MNAVKKTNLKTNVFDFNLLPLLTLMLIAFFFQGCGDPGEENIPTTNPQMNRLGDTTQEGDSDGGCSAAFIILKIVEKDVQMELTEGDMCDSIKIFSYKEDLNPIQDFDPGALFYVFQVHKEGVCQIQLTLASGAVVHRTLYGLPPTGGECDMVRAFAGLKIWRPDCEDPTFDSSNNGDCIAQKTQSENM